MNNMIIYRIFSWRDDSYSSLQSNIFMIIGDEHTQDLFLVFVISAGGKNFLNIFRL